MKRLLDNVNFLIIFIVIFILLIATAITYIVIYLPIKDEYEKNILTNFALSVGMNLKDIEDAEERDTIQIIEGVEVTKIDKDCAKRILNNYRKYEWIEKIDLIDEGEYISCISPIPGTDNYWYAKIKKSILLKPVQRISSIGLASFIIVVFFSFIFTNYTVIRKIRKLIFNLEMSKEKYKEYAVRDPVTGAYSRSFFQNWILDRSGELVNGIYSLSAIIMIDLDGFKEINDTYGHIVGDKVLRKIADIFKNSIREGDFVIRYGGDEFLILLKECDIEFCDQIISRIETKLKELNQYNIKISYGIEEIRDRTRLLDYIKKADEKMYKMKKKNKVKNKTRI